MEPGKSVCRAASSSDSNSEYETDSEVGINEIDTSQSNAKSDGSQSDAGNCPKSAKDVFREVPFSDVAVGLYSLIVYKYPNSEKNYTVECTRKDDSTGEVYFLCLQSLKNYVFKYRDNTIEDVVPIVNALVFFSPLKRSQ